MSGRLRKKHSESGCFKQCNIFENASLNGALNRLKLDEKRTWAHLAPPRLTVAPPGRLWGHPPAQKRTQINRKHVSAHENPEQKRRRPKTFQEHPTLAEVSHRGSDTVRSLPQKLSLRDAASRSLHQKPPAASKFPERGGLGEAHLDIRRTPSGLQGRNRTF